MNKEVLEVLIVGAEGFKHTSFLGFLAGRAYYVILQIGNEVFRSKIASGKSKKATWNEKFTFQLPHYWTSAQLHLKVMKLRSIVEDEFHGEAIVDLEGMLKEGREKGYKELMPAAYNIVSKDGTYKGEIKVGFKFTRIEISEVFSKKEKNMEEKNQVSRCRTIFSTMQAPWLNFYFISKYVYPNASKKQT